MKKALFVFAAILAAFDFVAAGDILRGGDVSQISYVESAGGAFKQDGKKKDPFEILASSGMNAVRIRIYVDPGNVDFSPSCRLPKRVSDLADALSQAKRAKACNMEIVLSLHYSDYWTNAGTQNKPHEWEGLAFNDLVRVFGDYTRETVAAFVSQGTPPAFVSIGNETRGGLLFPDANCMTGEFKNLARLYNAAHRAIKAACPGAKSVIHLDKAGEDGVYEWYFGELEKNDVRFDVIGSSYYPYWTNLDTKAIRKWADGIHSRFKKPILFMETGYAWTKNLPNGKLGQIEHNGPYDEYSQEGQKAFLEEFIDMILDAPQGEMLGFLYWDPVMIEVPGIGWELGADNVVANTTLFDFSGNVLPGAKAFSHRSVRHSPHERRR